MQRTESFAQYWERQITESEKRIAVAQSNIMRIHFQNQLQLFETEATVFPFEPKHMKAIRNLRES